MSAPKKLFVEKRDDGQFAVSKATAQRASALADTQKEAIEIAKKLNPGHSPDVERVRHTKNGDPDQWRKA
jgi:hypothetical protein